MQEKYAELLLKRCLNISNQPLLILCPIETYEFVRVLVKKAYEIGVKDIYIDFEDEGLKKSQLNNLSNEDLKNSSFFNKKIFDEYAKKDSCFLMLYAYEDFSDIDNKKLELSAKLVRETKPIYKEKQLKNEIVWCIASVVTKTWADKLFPNEEDNVNKLWNIIYKMCLIDKDNPIEEWNNKIKLNSKKSEFMNNKQYKKLTFKNSLGTNLTIELPKNHIWAGGNTVINGIETIANMPTEEIFTSPYKFGVNGIVYSSKPLVYNGSLIEDFYLEFKDGAVVNFDAKVGKDTLRQIIEYDENSKYLGEVALVDYDSPISKSNLIFYETLYDENAACHLALGSSYLECIKEPNFDIVNKSNTHVDFMIGTKDLEVIADGEIIMKDGNFIK